MKNYEKFHTMHAVIREDTGALLKVASKNACSRYIDRRIKKTGATYLLVEANVHLTDNAMSFHSVGDIFGDDGK